MKRLVIVVLLALSAAGLSACDQSIEDVKRDAEFVKVCKESGGKIVYNMFKQRFCNF